MKKQKKGNRKQTHNRKKNKKDFDISYSDIIDEIIKLNAGKNIIDEVIKFNTEKKIQEIAKNMIDCLHKVINDMKISEADKIIYKELWEENFSNIEDIEDLERRFEFLDMIMNIRFIAENEA